MKPVISRRTNLVFADDTIVVDAFDNSGWLEVHISDVPNQEVVTVFLSAPAMRQIARKLNATADDLDAIAPGPQLRSIPIEVR